MEFVTTEGRIQLEPIPGEEEGTRSGYILRITDIATKIAFICTLSHEDARRLGEVMVQDTSEHGPGKAPVSVEAVSPDVLRRLPKLRLRS